MKKLLNVGYKALDRLRKMDLVAPEFFNENERLKELIISKKLFNPKLIKGLYDFLLKDLKNRGCDISKNITVAHWSNDNLLIQDKDYDIKDCYRFMCHSDLFEIICLILNIAFYAPYIANEELFLSQVRHEIKSSDNQVDNIVYTNQGKILFTCDAKCRKRMIAEEEINVERYTKEVSSRKTICMQIYSKSFYNEKDITAQTNKQIKICVPNKKNVNFARLDCGRAINYYCLFAQESDCQTRQFIKCTLANMLSYIDAFFAEENR